MRFLQVRAAVGRQECDRRRIGLFGDRPCILARMTEPSSRRAARRAASRTTIAGSARPIVLVHAGIADRRMWDPQWPAFASVGRVDPLRRRGYGEIAAADRAVVAPRGPARPARRAGDGAGRLSSGRRWVRGSRSRRPSPGPRAVASLLLVAPGGALLGDAAESLRPVWHDEVEALDRGDVDGAVEVNLRAWVDGPTRSADAVDPEVRAFVGRMQRDAFELPEWDPEPPRSTSSRRRPRRRLREIRCPTLVARRRARPAGDAGGSDADRGRGRRGPARGLAGRRPRADARAARPTSSGSRSRSSPGGDAAHPRRAAYVALGDSYTIGTALDSPAGALAGPARRALRTSTGRRSRARREPRRQRLHVARRDRRTSCPRSRRWSPEFASILVGVNDVVQGVPADDYEANAGGDPRRAPRTPPADPRIVDGRDAGLHGHAAGRALRRPGDAVGRASGANNAILARLAAERGIAFVDIHDLSLGAAADRSLVADDGLHPSGAQYALWVDRIAPVVEDCLAWTGRRL